MLFQRTLNIKRRLGAGRRQNGAAPRAGGPGGRAGAQFILGQARIDGWDIAVLRRHAMTRPKRSTKDKLMDAAEKLFARRGFHGASLRDITGVAGVDLALVNYHFGSKHGL